MALGSEYWNTRFSRVGRFIESQQAGLALSRINIAAEIKEADCISDKATNDRFRSRFGISDRITGTKQTGIILTLCRFNKLVQMSLQLLLE